MGQGAGLRKRVAGQLPLQGFTPAVSDGQRQAWLHVAVLVHDVRRLVVRQEFGVRAPPQGRMEMRLNVRVHVVTELGRITGVVRVEDDHLAGRGVGVHPRVKLLRSDLDAPNLGIGHGDAVNRRRNLIHDHRVAAEHRLDQLRVGNGGRDKERE
ncbi:hypothetical protein LV35_00272 [Acinetobacter baumannii]|uniref:Uncharacterized protein n=1 Tax=Acinetobacter baumannii TaxID=470 RepID=A0AAJ0R074_ACIBA|nr:hypothetical protein LV35_00272 [Acinetobacter baumannii]